MDFISCFPAVCHLCALFLLSKISSMHRRGCRRDGVRLNTGGALPCPIASRTTCFSVRPLWMWFSFCVSEMCVCVCFFLGYLQIFCGFLLLAGLFIFISIFLTANFWLFSPNSHSHRIFDFHFHSILFSLPPILFFHAPATQNDSHRPPTLRWI